MLEGCEILLSSKCSLHTLVPTYQNDDLKNHTDLLQYSYYPNNSTGHYKRTGYLIGFLVFWEKHKKLLFIYLFFLKISPKK